MKYDIATCQRFDEVFPVSEIPADIFLLGNRQGCVGSRTIENAYVMTCLHEGQVELASEETAAAEYHALHRSFASAALERAARFAASIAYR